jgi:hypothetical protein
MCVNCGTNSCGGCGSWQLPTGATGANGATGPTGSQGISVVGASIDGNDHLILDMSSGPDIDAGLLPQGTPGYTLIHNDNVESYNQGLAGLNPLSPAKTFPYNPANPDHELLTNDTLRIVAEFEIVTGSGVPGKSAAAFNICLGGDTIICTPDDSTTLIPYTCEIIQPSLTSKPRAGVCVVEIEINLKANPAQQLVIVKVFNGAFLLAGRKTMAVDFTAALNIYIKDIATGPQFPVNTLVCKHFKVERHKQPV